MLEAAIWGFLAASTLLLGAVLAMVRPWSRRSIGMVTGFGVGALISAVTLDLTASAFEEAGVVAVVVSLAAGAVVYTLGNVVLARGGIGRNRKRSGGQQAGTNSLGIVLGTVLDGIPESIVIGMSLASGEGIGIAFVLAVAISNLPEALSASTGLLRASWDRGRILRLWLAVAALSAAAAAVGLLIASNVQPAFGGMVEAFAAGAVLTMLADTMMPEAFDEAGPAVGLATVAGYALGALLTLL